MYRGDDITGHIRQALGADVRAGDIVAMTMAARYFTDPKLSGMHHNVNLYFSFVDMLYNVTQPRGAALVIFSDVPYQVHAPGWCKPTKFQSSSTRTCGVLQSDSVSRFATFFGRLQNLTARPGMFFYDYHDLFCDGLECTMFIPGTYITASWDGDHLNAEGQHYLWPFFCSFFRSHGLFNYNTSRP
jgi:hypothetical protein